MHVHFNAKTGLSMGIPSECICLQRKISIMNQRPGLLEQNEKHCAESIKISLFSQSILDYPEALNSLKTVLKGFTEEEITYFGGRKKFAQLTNFLENNSTNS